MSNSSQYERYHRQIILKEFGEAGQQKLSEASVLVIGAGGLGCPALQYLAAAGVGTLGIVDDDVVSLSNLHRQVLYTTADVGLLKTEQASKRLQSLNPDIQIVTYAQRLISTNALTIISQYDYIIDGTDNFATRYLINDVCYLLNKPLVYGAVSRFEGQVAVFIVKDEHGVQTNYRDLFPDAPNDQDVLNCAEAGVLGVLPGIIGTMQANETIKLITKIGTPLINKILTYNAINNQVYDVELSPSKIDNGIPRNEVEFLSRNYNTTCNADTDLEIDNEMFNHYIKQKDVAIIDVRELDELPIVEEFNWLRMPLQSIQADTVELQEKVVITFCQSGKRSLQAAKLLKNRYGISKKIFSLKGGINTWIKHQEKL